MQDARIRAREYTRINGEDIPEVRDWVWPDAANQADSGSVDATLSTGGDNE
jgi:xylulose-5-phosphate/fructose-6-phosphate phosphoketolase